MAIRSYWLTPYAWGQYRLDNHETQCTVLTLRIASTSPLTSRVTVICTPAGPRDDLGRFIEHIHIEFLEVDFMSVLIRN